MQLLHRFICLFLRGPWTAAVHSFTQRLANPLSQVCHAVFSPHAVLGFPSIQGEAHCE